MRKTGQYLNKIQKHTMGTIKQKHTMGTIKQKHTMGTIKLKNGGHGNQSKGKWKPWDITVNS